MGRKRASFEFHPTPIQNLTTPISTHLSWRATIRCRRVGLAAGVAEVVHPDGGVEVNVVGRDSGGRLGRFSEIIDACGRTGQRRQVY